MANAVKDMSDRIDLRVKKSLQLTDKAKQRKGIVKARPFPSVKPWVCRPAIIFGIFKTVPGGRV